MGPRLGSCLDKRVERKTDRVVAGGVARILPRPAVSAISTVAAVAILWHRRGTSRVELRLGSVIEGAVVCPGLRHGFRFNPRARLRFVISSVSLVFHLHIVMGDEAGVERIRGHRRRCHAAAEWLRKSVSQAESSSLSYPFR
jgi:hypothetical protein